MIILLSLVLSCVITFFLYAFYMAWDWGRQIRKWKKWNRDFHTIMEKQFGERIEHNE